MDLVIGDIFRNAARAVPDRLAACLGDDSLTYSELDRRSDAAGAALAALGIGRGDRVSAWGDTSLELVVLFGALAKLGAVFSPLNTAAGPGDADASLAVTRPDLLIVDERLRDKPTPPCRAISLSDLLDSTDAATYPPPRESDTHTVFLTSGSTGRPRGVAISHRASYLRSFQGALLEPRGATVCMFPLFHMAGWLIALGAWQTRSTCRFVTRASADEILDAIEREAAERLYAIPAVWRRVLDADHERRNVASLRVADTGTSATPPELLDAIGAAFPNAIRRVFYGSTETGPSLMLEDHEIAAHPGAVGRPQPGVRARLSDTGELLVRSAYMFDGYTDDPEATRAVFVDGWYRSGDLAECDDSGCFSIIGRVGDVIRTGGESVGPADVETVVAAHASVADCAVVGLPDTEWGELVCAVVVPNGEIDLVELEAHCASSLAPFKRPRRFEIVTEIPRTAATGQVQRPLLVNRLGSE